MHSTKCFDEFARDHLEAEPSHPASTATSTLASSHRFATSTFDALAELAEGWGSASEEKIEQPKPPALAALPADARRAFLRDAAAGRIHGTSSEAVAGAWTAWWECEDSGTGQTSRLRLSKSTVYGKQIITTISTSEHEVSKTKDPPLAQLATLGTSAAALESETSAAAIESMALPLLRSPPWSASRVLGLFDTSCMPPLTTLTHRGPSSALLRPLAVTLFASAFVWRLFNGDPAGVDAVDATEVLGSLAVDLAGRSADVVGSAEESIHSGAGQSIPHDDGVRAALVLTATASQGVVGVSTSLEFAAGAVADVGVIAKDRRNLVRMLANAMELVGVAIVDTLVRGRISTEDAINGDKLLKSKLKLPHLVVRDSEWRSAAHALFRIHAEQRHPADDEVVAKPHHDEVVAKPHHDEVVAKPHHDEDTPAKPHHDEAVAKPHHDEAVAKPHHDEAVAKPHHDEAVAKPVFRSHGLQQARALRRAVAAYRKLWFYCVYAACAPTDWFDQMAKGSRTAVTELVAASEEAAEIQRDASGTARLARELQAAQTPRNRPQIRVVAAAGSLSPATTSSATASSGSSRAAQAALRLKQLRLLPASRADTVESMD